jgi:hypothetical protein
MTIENKMVVPFELKADEITEEGTFKGYGSVFGNKDAHSDVMMPGCFTKTLLAGGRNGTGVAMLLQHDSRKPIGIWTLLAEDNKGLRVEGQLALKTKDGSETHELMKMGALKGLSIGYDSVITEYDEKKKVRYLKEVELWEVSPVTFGANTKAQITSVKEFMKDAKTVRDLENILRDSGHFSKTDAQQFIAIFKEALRDSEEREEPKSEALLLILDGLKSVNKKINDSGMTDILNGLKQINQ